MNGNYGYNNYNDNNAENTFDQNTQVSYDNVNQNYNQSGDIYNSGYGLQNNSYEGSSSYVNDSNVVFEASNLATPQEKVKYYVSTINKKAVTFIVGVILGILLLVLIVMFIISRYNNSYKSNIDIPSIIYMEESNVITVNSTGKKDVDKTVTTFQSSDENIIYIVDSELTGSKVQTTLVPISEGKAKISVKSKLKNKKMGSLEKDVTVCPAFNSSLIVNDHLSVVKDSSLELSIDYGEEVCKEGITYETNNPSIMTVDKDGTIKATGVGSAVLSIKKDNRILTIPVTVTEKSVTMTDFESVPSVVQLNEGELIRLGIKSIPADATSSKITYSGYDNKIIDVSKGGVIKALKSGATTLKVSPSFSYSKDVAVIVGKDESVNAASISSIKLDKKDIKLIEGTSTKIYPLLIPNNANDRTIKWQSSNEEVAIVKNGIVYGRSEGEATISATAINNVSETLSVKVETIKKPTITTSDGVESGNWHTGAYYLSFNSPLSSVIYKYGTSETKLNKEANQIAITSDEQKTYFISTCLYNHCSSPEAYISNVDTIKPKVLKAIGLQNQNIKENGIKIAIKDDGSLVEKWCVTDNENSYTCKWNKIEKQAAPVITFKPTKNGIYYAFAKDTAGNTSDQYKFEITTIQ